jgi:hypothetical protein
MYDTVVEPVAPTNDKIRLKSLTVKAIIREVVRKITCGKNLLLDHVFDKSQITS